MESLLHIIACGFAELFRHTPNDEKRAMSKIYLVFRELCKWSRYSMDYWLPPLRAKHVFIIMMEEKRGDNTTRFETTPDGYRNGLSVCTKFVGATVGCTTANGAVQTTYYLRNFSLWRVRTKRTQNTVVIERHRRDPNRPGVFCLYAEEKFGSNVKYHNYIRVGNLTIMRVIDEIMIIMLVRNLIFTEIQHASGYELNVTNLRKSFRVSFYYKKSHIYAVHEDTWLLAKLISIGDLPYKTSEILGEIRSAMRWRAHKY